MKKEDIKPGPTRFDQLPADVLTTSTIGRTKYNVVPGDKGLSQLLKPFLDKNSIRVWANELRFDKEYQQVIACDGHRLVMLPGPVEKTGSFTPDGKASNERYPDYVTAIPLDVNSTVCSVSCRPLRSYLQAAKLFVNQTTYHTYFHITGNRWIAIDAKMLVQLLTFFERLGHSVIQVTFHQAQKGIIFSAGSYNGLGKQATVLQMPRGEYDDGEPKQPVKVHWPTDLDVHTELRAYWSFSADTVIVEDGKQAVYDTLTHTWKHPVPATKPVLTLSDQQFLLLRAQALLLILRLRLRLSA